LHQRRSGVLHGSIIDCSGAKLAHGQSWGDARSWGHMPLVYVVDLWDEVAWKSKGNGEFGTQPPRSPDSLTMPRHPTYLEKEIP